MNNNITLQHFEKNNNINKQIYDRNVPSQKLENNFSSRPVQMRYNKMPLLDNRETPKVSMETHPIYNSEQIFFPGTRRPHFSGFATNVDEESLLRNQYFALQKCDRAQYIPDSTSDMYIHNIAHRNTNYDVQNQVLFQTPQFNDFNPNISNRIGSELFNNSTRVQLKNL